MNLAAGVEGAADANFLAFELLHLILVVNIVSCAAVGILKHELVSRFYDGASKDLACCLRRIRGLSGSGRILPGLLLRLLSGHLTGLLWRVSRIPGWRRLCMKRQAESHHGARYNQQHGKPQSLCPTLFALVHEAS
jgi:hypothetical protein